MKLSNFEKKMNSIILGRGLYFYKTNKIVWMHETDGTFEAEISGSSKYNVQAKIRNGDSIVFSEFDCPYDYREYCKQKGKCKFGRFILILVRCLSNPFF